jgi:hypothetical protein
MTITARIVLNDCREAAELFLHGIQGSKWRIIYIANVALLRAVYHVLKNEAKASPLLHQIFQKWNSDLGASKSSHDIYWEFIISERNMMLKEYSSTAGQGVTIPGVLFEINVQTNEQKVTRLGQVEYHYTMNSGPFVGRDQRDLIAEAITWWEQQLDEIDRRVNVANS